MLAIIPSLQISIPSDVLRFDSVVDRKPATAPLFKHDMILFLKNVFGMINLQSEVLQFMAVQDSFKVLGYFLIDQFTIKKLQ